MQCDAQSIRGAFSIRRIGFQAIADITVLDFARYGADGASGITKQRLLLLWRHQPEQRAGPRIVIGTLTVIPVIGLAFDGQWRFAEIRLLPPFTVTVELITQCAAVITAGPHSTVAVIAVERLAWCGRSPEYRGRT